MTTNEPLAPGQTIEIDGRPAYVRHVLARPTRIPSNRVCFTWTDDGVKGYRDMPVDAERCYCPDDCNCRVEWRTSYCGCPVH